jgi:hypothetical protein
VVGVTIGSLYSTAACTASSLGGLLSCRGFSQYTFTCCDHRAAASVVAGSASHPPAFLCLFFEFLLEPLQPAPEQELD